MTLQCSAQKPWVLAFKWTIQAYLQTKTKPQLHTKHHLSWQHHYLIAVAPQAEKCCRNCSGLYQLFLQLMWLIGVHCELKYDFYIPKSINPLTSADLSWLCRLLTVHNLFYRSCSPSHTRNHHKPSHTRHHHQHSHTRTHHKPSHTRHHHQHSHTRTHHQHSHIRNHHQHSHTRNNYQHSHTRSDHKASHTSNHYKHSHTSSQHKSRDPVYNKWSTSNYIWSDTYNHCFIQRPSWLLCNKAWWGLCQTWCSKFLLQLC